MTAAPEPGGAGLQRRSLPAALPGKPGRTDPPADEIIVVDDGSTDDCPRILADWGPRLPQMRVIRQENGGLSAARNTGLDAASGKYLAFVDSDDFRGGRLRRSACAWPRTTSLDMVLLNATLPLSKAANPTIAIYRDVPATEESSPAASGCGNAARRTLPAHGLDAPLSPRLHRAKSLSLRSATDSRGRDLDHRGAARRRSPALHRPHRRALPDTRAPLRNTAAQRRLQAIVDSSVVNARGPGKCAPKSDRYRTSPCSPTIWSTARSRYFTSCRRCPTANRGNTARLRRKGFMALLWRHAQPRTISTHRAPLAALLAGLGRRMNPATTPITWFWQLWLAAVVFVFPCPAPSPCATCCC
jgi:hypothetical protein